MLNYIWLGLVILAVVIGGCTGNLKAVADKSFEMAKTAVIDTAFPLIGIMALWLGVMRLAERAGLVSLLARALRPIMSRLFPEVPPEHPAMGSMLMNLAANMLGLGNAATPLGLRAMKDLESLNPRPGTATDAMCTFLALNTSSIQLIPVTAIAILAANRAVNPSAIVGTALIASVVGTIAAVTASKLLSGMRAFWLPPADSVPPSAHNTTEAASVIKDEGVGVREAESLRPIAWWGHAILAGFLLFFLGLFLRMTFPELFGLTLPEEMKQQSMFVRMINCISLLSIPFLLSIFPLYAALRRVRVYEEFVEGAKEGFEVAIRIIPYLVAILLAIGMFRAAGGIDIITQALKPMMTAIRFPSELLPMVLMRPLSGSGSLGIFTELVHTFGPDSFLARTAGTIFGSTETTFYVLAVYFGAVGVKRARYSVIAGLVGDAAGFIASVIVCRAVFG